MIKYYHNLIYLLPVGLITGPLVTNFIVIFCSIFFLIETFKNKLFKYYNNNFFKIFIILFILMNLSSIFSENLKSFKYSIGYLRYGVFSVFVFYVLKNYEKFKINFSYLTIILFSIIFIDSLIQYIFETNSVGFNLQKYKTGLPYITSFFNDEKILGSYISRMFPLLFFSIMVIYQHHKEREYSKFLILLIPLSLIIVVLTTERIAIFILFLSIILILIKSDIFLEKKKMYISIFFIPIIIFLIFNPLLFEKIKSIFYSMGLLSPELTADGRIIGGYDNVFYIFSKFHHEQIINSLEIFKENPIFGIGAKNFKYLSDVGWHPHNFHAQILAELGILSYLVLLFVIFLLLHNTYKLFLTNKTSVKEQIKLLTIFSILLFIIPIPSADFFNNWINSIVYLVIGFYLYLNEKKT